MGLAGWFGGWLRRPGQVTLTIRERPTVRGHLKLTIRDATTGRVKRIAESDNVVCQVGEWFFPALLNGEAFYNGFGPFPSGGSGIGQFQSYIYGAVGTSSTTPAATDTALGNELARASVALSSRTQGQVTLNFFFTTAQAIGTITEAGVFLFAATTANSGALFNHALLGSVTKNNTETATLEGTVSFS